MSLIQRFALGVTASLALFAATAHAQTAVQTVDADIGSALSISITTPFTPASWALANGTNTNSTLVLTALANVNYAIRVNCDSDVNKGTHNTSLSEFGAGAYLVTTTATGALAGTAAKFIAAALGIRSTGAGATTAITTTAGGVGLVNATGQQPTPSAGRTHTVELSQLVDFGDVSLAASGATSAYHMVITYTILAGAV
jgi:hypothetical protein